LKFLFTSEACFSMLKLEDALFHGLIIPKTWSPIRAVSATMVPFPLMDMWRTAEAEHAQIFESVSVALELY